jgi:hypothetical protein
MSNVKIRFLFLARDSSIRAARLLRCLITCQPRTRSGLAEQYAAIAQLGEALPQGFSIKDAFDTLDLTKFGFHVLFDAEWIWFQPSPVARPKSRSSSWSQIETERELIRWEAAWAASGSPTASPVFLPTLLTDASLAFFGAQRDGQIVAGCIANCSRAGVVGFSNFFAPDSGRDRYRSEAVALVADFAKGNPLVGYDRGAELEGLQALGFRCVGPLRVWLRPAQLNPNRIKFAVQNESDVP